MVHPLLQDKTLKLSMLNGKDGDSDATNRNADPASLTAENFHEFFIRYSRPILSFIHAMIQDRASAEELCQETFIRAFRRLDSRSSQGMPSAWIFGIARNVIREAVKNKYRCLRHVPLDEGLEGKLDAGLEGADQRLMSEELHDRIRDSLALLTEDQKLVFILKLIHKLKYDEIAEMTGASISKLKVDLHRARREMRRNLQAYLQGEGD